MRRQVENSYTNDSRHLFYMCLLSMYRRNWRLERRNGDFHGRESHLHRCFLDLSASEFGDVVAFVSRLGCTDTIYEIFDSLTSLESREMP